MTLSYSEAKRLVAKALRHRIDPDLEAAAWRGLHRALDSWDPARGPLDSWALYNMRHYITNQYSLRVPPTSPIDDVALSVPARPHRGDPLLRRVLNKAVAALPSRQSEAVRLCLIEELDRRAAGALMGGISPQAVTQLVHRACENLQRQLRHEATS